MSFDEPNMVNMSGMQNVSRKRNKKRYMSGQPNKRYRYNRELQVGMQGVLVTCGNNNMRPCTIEAMDLLIEYADKLYGPEVLPDQFGSSGQNEDEEEDVDVALKKEVAQLRAQRTDEKKRFQVLESGAFNVIFIRTRNIEPDRLIHYIMSDLHATKQKKSRLVLRMLPVVGTCRPYHEDIMKYLTMFLAPWFKAPNHGTFKVAYKARNNNQHRREEIIKNVAGILARLNPKNRANLMNPDYAVVVEIIKNVCCVSVVKDYKLFKKYNVYEIVKDLPDPDAATTKTDAEMKERHSGEEGDKEEGNMEESDRKEESHDKKEGDEGDDAQDEEVNEGGDDVQVKEEVNEGGDAVQVNEVNEGGDDTQDNEEVNEGLSKKPKKRYRDNQELQVGMQGVLVTCGNNNMRPCTIEAMDLLIEYADKLYGPEVLPDQFGSSGQNEAEEEDVDVALKKEVAQLRPQRTNEEKRFQVLDSGAFNVIFIRTRNIEPDRLIHYIMSDLHATKQKKSRLVLRMLPVVGTCRPYHEDIMKYLTVFLAPWFKAPNHGTFKVAYKARNNNQYRSEEIIKNVAGILARLNPKNGANLMNPDYAVVVEIIKNVCCVSVVKDYKLFKKYNIYEIVKDSPDPDAATTKTVVEMKERHNGEEGDKEEGNMEESDRKEESHDKKEGDEGDDAQDEEVNEGGDDVQVNEVNEGGDDTQDNEGGVDVQVKEDVNVGEMEGNENDGDGEANMGQGEHEEVHQSVNQLDL